jgi:hypothetical protein
LQHFNKIRAESPFHKAAEAFKIMLYMLFINRLKTNERKPKDGRIGAKTGGPALGT